MENEKRLINVNPAYIQHILAKVPYYADEIWKFTCMTQRFPTVDAVPVVHGRWLNWRGEPIMPDDYWRLWRCSVCNNEWEYPKAVDADEVSFHYCPNCGAKMDGDGNA